MNSRARIAVLALVGALAVAGCGSGSGSAASGGSAGGGSSSGSAGGSGSPVTEAPPAAAVPLAQVEQLVAAAPSIKAVPANITPSIQNAPKDDAFGLLGSRGCLPTFSTTSIPIANCVFGDPTGTHTMVILGDSHSAMWLPALDAVGQRTGWKVIDLNKVSCPAYDVTVYLKQQARTYTQCHTWIQWAINTINTTVKPDIFIATSEAGYNIVGSGSIESGLAQTLQSVDARAKVVLGDMPYLQQDGPDCLAAHESDVQACSVPEPAALNTAGRTAEMAAARTAGATYIDVVPWFCSSTCTAIVGNMIINQDGQHITRTYASFLSGALQAALAPAMAAA